MRNLLAILFLHSVFPLSFSHEAVKNEILFLIVRLRCSKANSCVYFPSFGIFPGAGTSLIYMWGKIPVARDQYSERW